MHPRPLFGIVACALLAFGPAIAAETSGQQLAQSAGRGLVGSMAPRLVLTTIDSKTVDLGRLYGKQAVYLKFWATWCVPCREQMPHFEHAYQTAGPDLAVIAIDVGFGDSIDAIREFQRRTGITMPVVFDEDGHVGGAFSLRVTPQHVVIGRDGRIQYIGHLADAHLDAALLAARAASEGSAKPAASGEPAAVSRPQLAVDDVLPAQSVPLLGGATFQLKQLAALRPTVFVFLSPWCESYLATTRPAVSANCRRVREQVNALAPQRKVRWLGIASGLWAKPDDLRTYRKDYNVTIPLALDSSGTLFREFRVNDVPTVVVADAAGRIVQRVEPSDTRGLARALDALCPAAERGKDCRNDDGSNKINRLDIDVGGRRGPAARSSRRPEQRARYIQ